jgi:CHASE2 domain-containing sensor protein
VIRRVPVMLALGDEIIPSFFAETLRVSQGQTGYRVNTSPEQGAGVESVAVGPLRIPTSREGEMWIRYTHGGAARRTVPAWRVFAGELAPDAFAGSMVLVGVPPRACSTCASARSAASCPGCRSTPWRSSKCWQGIRSAGPTGPLAPRPR